MYQIVLQIISLNCFYSGYSLNMFCLFSPFLSGAHLQTFRNNLNKVSLVFSNVFSSLSFPPAPGMAASYSASTVFLIFRSQLLLIFDMNLGKWVCTRGMGSSILMCISYLKDLKVNQIVEGIGSPLHLLDPNNTAVRILRQKEMKGPQKCSNFVLILVWYARFLFQLL